jgi:hypothetical protein
LEGKALRITVVLRTYNNKLEKVIEAGRYWTPCPPSVNEVIDWNGIKYSVAARSWSGGVEVSDHIYCYLDLTKLEA